MKRWLIWAAILFAIGAPVVAIAHHIQAPIAEQRARFAEIELGMGKEEALALMRPGEEVKLVRGRMWPQRRLPKARYRIVWKEVNSSGSYWVYLDSEERVIDKNYSPLHVVWQY
jgi:hypothetical protein